MGVKEKLYRIYWSMERVITPTLRFSQALYEDVLKQHVNEDTKWLDLGCGHQILPFWRVEEEKKLVQRCKSVVGIDYDLDSLRNHSNVSRRVRGSITSLPFKNGTFTLVTANMVVEHLENPGEQFREVNRVLAPGGLFIFHTPNAHGYGTVMARMVPERFKSRLIYVLDDRKEEDVFETHYKANTRKKIEELAARTGFGIHKMQMLVTGAIFAVVPPLAIVELIWIRILMTEPCKFLRTNIIAIMGKASEKQTTDRREEAPMRKAVEAHAKFAEK
jgi:ubiquinone/menaquinone biosynthesis C-methylase UbiE